MLLMKKENRSTDRHLTKSKTTVRLGEPARTMLKQIADEEERTQAVILTRALKLYAKENGFKWPDRREGDDEDE